MAHIQNHPTPRDPANSSVCALCEQCTTPNQATLTAIEESQRLAHDPPSPSFTSIEALKKALI